MTGFATVMISCGERDAVRTRTLMNLARTDWPSQVMVSMAGSDLPTPQARQTANSLEALKRGLTADREFILFLEDDLEFNRHLHHNLTHWPVLQHVTMASLYNPNIRELRRMPELHCFEAVPDAIYGSQAYLFSRACAEWIVERWGTIVGMQDILCSRLAAQLGLPIYYFQPSLVQHVGKESTFGGGFHYTKDFDPEFKL